MKSSCIGAGVLAAKFANCGLAIFGDSVASPLVMYGSMLCLTVVGVCVAVVIREFACVNDPTRADEAELAFQRT